MNNNKLIIISGSVIIIVLLYTFISSPALNKKIMKKYNKIKNYILKLIQQYPLYCCIVVLIFLGGIVATIYFYKKNIIRCSHTYALCTGAKCVPNPFNKDEGTCKCIIEKGDNYSYGNKKCSDLRPYKDTKTGIKYLYSTYNPKLGMKSENEEIWCPASGVNYNCLNKKCIINPHNKNEAYCICKRSDNKGKSWVFTNKKGAKTKCSYLSGSLEGRPLKNVLDMNLTVSD